MKIRSAGIIVAVVSMIHYHNLGNAQDMQFTQFYAAQTFLNPAFTGIHGCTRIASNFRDQWPSIPGSYTSYTFSYDQYVSSFNSSFGLLLTNDKAGSGSLRSTGITALYAYEIPVSYGWMIRAGLEGGIGTRNINYHELVFGDQIARGGAATSIHNHTNTEMALYPDFSTGLVAYSENLWLGFSAHHINEPNQSLIGEESIIPVKYSVHAGAKIEMEDFSGARSDKRNTIYPAFNYKSQGKFDQVDLGFYYGYSAMTLGIWYRGIPLLKAYQKGYANNDAIALLAGFVVDKLQIGYSYDFTFSRLINSTAGAHEVTLNYIICRPHKKKKRRIKVPCPKF